MPSLRGSKIVPAMRYQKKREAWRLKKQGLSYTQIAEQLGVSAGEVLDRL
jgi:hypothetical protein